MRKNYRLTCFLAQFGQKLESCLQTVAGKKYTTALFT